MPELRLNVVTNEWVIIARERATRPHEFGQTEPGAPLPRRKEDCPFCPGNEALAAGEALRLGLAGRDLWQVRSVANKYPALSSSVTPHVTRRGLQHAVEGFGIHEVIIETPRHDLCLAQLSLAEVAAVLQSYRLRYEACLEDERIAHVLLFKNHGVSAGTSLVHPHSQMIATPVVSAQVEDRIKVMRAYREEHDACLLCQMITQEIEEGLRILLLSKHFVAMIPYAALSSFHIWIFPRRHMACFEEIVDEELLDLARTLRTILQQLYYGLKDPDFNYVIRSAPQRCPHQEFHWYLSVVPRLSRAAGFELGSGMYINTVPPEDSAAFLRQVELPSEDEPLPTLSSIEFLQPELE